MNVTYFLGWCLFRLMYATYFRWRVYNPERVPLKGGVILASNHASFLDPPHRRLGTASADQLSCPCQPVSLSRRRLAAPQVERCAGGP
jgi:hypothetical protein